MPRILVINSCGKAKVTSFKGQPHCQDLLTEKSRNSHKSELSHLLLPARDLYTGTQAKMVAQAVELMKTKYSVDYYIISAGFGLVSEDELLPPYECTFSGKSKKEIRAMASRLNIEEDLLNLDTGYDLIYLALGKNYLIPFNLELFRSKGSEIINFDRDSELRAPFHSIDDTLILGKSDKIDLFIHKPGGLVSTKGGILLNYAEYITTHSFTAFNEWWSLIENELMNDRSLLTMSHTVKIESHDKNNIFNFDQSQRRTDYLPTDKAIREAERIASKLSDDKITLIQELSEGLNPPQQKSTLETYGDWVDPYKDYKNEIEELVDFIDSSIDQIQNNTDENKSQSRKAIADAIRSRQENLGFEKYLCNPVKLSLFSTILKYIDDPDKLKEKLPEKKSSSKRKIKKKKNNPLDYEIRIDRFGEKDGKLEIIGILINKEPHPLQNLQIEILDEAGQKLMISRAMGRMFEIASGVVNIPFVGASMEGASYSENFRIILDSWADLDDGFTLITQVENTIAGEVETNEFNF